MFHPLITSRGRKRRGFTLVELLVVILILGILIAVAAPAFLGQLERAQVSKVEQDEAVAYKAAKAAAVSNVPQGAFDPGATLVSDITESESELRVSSASGVPASTGTIDVGASTAARFCGVGSTPHGTDVAYVAPNGGPIAISTGSNFDVSTCLASFTSAPSVPIITTVAGNGTAGDLGDGGAGTSAEISYPPGIAVDSLGNVYIPDECVVRELQVSGSITTMAGTGVCGHTGDGGLATSAELNGPSAVAVESAGDVFIADVNDCRVREVSATIHNISTVAGNGSCNYSTFTGAGSQATAVALPPPTSVAVDITGNLFIQGAGGGNRVLKVNTAGVISLYAGPAAATQGYTGDGGPATSALLNSANDHGNGIAVDSSGNLYIADSSNGVVREVPAVSGTEFGQAMTAGNIYTVAGNGNGAYTGDGGAATNAAIGEPEGVAIDSAGNLYIADSSNSVVREVLSTTGNISTVAGTGWLGFAGDGGPATAARMTFPQGVAVGPTGAIYIADTYNQRIRRVQ